MSHDELFSDELLSAYVDGELTEQERAIVEQRLESDPEARQFLSELQDLSTALRALPQEKVGSDLRARVLEGHKKELNQASSMPRRWIWPVAALAAALFLSIYLPNNQPEEEIQLAEKAKISPPVPNKPSSQPKSFRALAAETKSEPEAALVDGSLLDDETLRPDFQARERLQTMEGVRLEAATVKEEPRVYRIHLTLSEPQRFRELLAEKGIGQQPREISRAVQPVQDRQEILVSASPSSIEEVLKACHQDSASLYALRIDEEVKENKQLASWGKWEREESSRVSALSGRTPVDSRGNLRRESRSFEQVEENITPLAVGEPAISSSDSGFLSQSEADAELKDEAVAEPKDKVNAEPVTVLFILHLPTNSGPNEEPR